MARLKGFSALSNSEACCRYRTSALKGFGRKKWHPVLPGLTSSRRSYKVYLADGADCFLGLVLKSPEDTCMNSLTRMWISNPSQNDAISLNIVAPQDTAWSGCQFIFLTISVLITFCAWGGTPSQKEKAKGEWSRDTPCSPTEVGRQLQPCLSMETCWEGKHGHHPSIIMSKYRDYSQTSSPNRLLRSEAQITSKSSCVSSKVRKIAEIL